ncbi:MAG: hypothetical protein AAFY58_08020, partial [Planctomycetota bacterium]
MAVITAVLLFAWNQETPDVARKTSATGSAAGAPSHGLNTSNATLESEDGIVGHSGAARTVVDVGPDEKKDAPDTSSPSPAPPTSAGGWRWDRVDRELETLMRLQNPEGVERGLIGSPDPPSARWLHQRYGIPLDAAHIDRVLAVAELETRKV